MNLEEHHLEELREEFISRVSNAEFFYSGARDEVGYVADLVTRASAAADARVDLRREVDYYTRESLSIRERIESDSPPMGEEIICGFLIAASAAIRRAAEDSSAAQ